MPITLEGTILEDVESFTYLGSIIDRQGGTDADIKARIGKARVTFNQMKKVGSWFQKATDIYQLMSPKDTQNPLAKSHHQ